MKRPLTILLASFALAGAGTGKTTDFGYTVVAAPDHVSSTLDLGSPGFDNSNTAYFRAGSVLYVVKPGKGVEKLDFGAAVSTAINRDILKNKQRWDGAWDQSDMVDDAIVFDDQDRAYTLIIPRNSKTLKNAALLWSTDHCRTWHAVPLASRNATIEKRDGFNDHDGPPTVLSYEAYSTYPGSRLWINLMVWRNGILVPEAQTLLSDHSALVSNHSGGGNSTFTTPKKVFVVYDTTDSSAPGTQSVILEYDRSSHRIVGSEKNLGRSGTPTKGPDPHDIPAITADPSGRLMVVIGAHHAQFRMLTAREPWSIAQWEGPVSLGEPAQGHRYGSYSYVSLNTSRDGTINIIARSEGTGGYFQLVQLRRPAGKSWEIWDGLRHRVLVTPHRVSYAAWRQQVTMDRQGRLYLNFRYYPNMFTSQEAKAAGLAGGKVSYCPGNGRCFYDKAPDRAPLTLVSNDEGQTWR